MGGGFTHGCTWAILRAAEEKHFGMREVVFPRVGEAPRRRSRLGTAGTETQQGNHCARVLSVGEGR